MAQAMITDSVGTGGYFPPGSVSRRVIGDPAALVGGISALFLQALHPRAMAGVDQHSSFPNDFWPRLRRTAEYVTTLAFADTAQADAAVARVRAVHRHVRGVDPVSGRSYAAEDPDLLRWVHVTEVSSFGRAVHRLGLIDDAGLDTFLAEQVRAGALLGATDLPSSAAEVEAYFEAVRPELVASPVARRAALRLLAPPLPTAVELFTPARPAWTVVAAVAFSLLPPWARRLYGVPVPPAVLAPVSDATTTAALRGLRLALLAVRRASRRPAPPR
ncbi:oxygenase MpaB family protein [Pseudonocardia bannensis]|uniref:DUF2236 domain-containing protein n=1 Tax=Pseudonocardia bannensis TaxID=630973 RepID=A0A848DLL6_9PSEU|nr:oxygenase MpaB family protein [Pseudonocardia bannensis]NMH93608.1 DUF2236 domain-containing protein [Pseudonocardia bannensis]